MLKVSRLRNKGPVIMVLLSESETCFLSCGHSWLGRWFVLHDWWESSVDWMHLWIVTKQLSVEIPLLVFWVVLVGFIRSPALIIRPSGVFVDGISVLEIVSTWRLITLHVEPNVGLTSF